jgi:hypothetical protein
MFLDCPAYLDVEGAVRCGLPAACLGQAGRPRSSPGSRTPVQRALTAAVCCQLPGPG